jgi:hypothetical protein
MAFEGFGSKKGELLSGVAYLRRSAFFYLPFFTFAAHFLRQEA